jgi:transcription termination/antitermination protein NusA
VNDDQLSLAIGKRGQNVRLAARLTGWDIDILTPPEFQNGVLRLDQTLKAIEGVTQEMVDKIIALGLIDVRDIEEVGAGPLMEELGLTEELAQRIVDRCTEEAKIVAVEQEQKKAAEARAKAADAAALMTAGMKGVDAQAFANPLLPQADDASATSEASATSASATTEAAVATEEPITEEEASTESETSDRMPLPMEATEGIAPELTTHKEVPFGLSEEMSPEERAVQGVLPGLEGGDAVQMEDPGTRTEVDEDGETAALAEGRTRRPASSDEQG